MRAKLVEHLKQDWPKGAKEHVLPITEKRLAHLPELVVKHFEAVCLLGQDEVFNSIIDWDKAITRFSPTQKWVPVQMTQLNAAEPAMRFAWYLAKKFGLPVLSGLESLCDASYELNVNFIFRSLACIPPKKVNPSETRDRMALKSAMTQILAEAFLMPGMALHPAIQWEKVDSREVAARFTYPCVATQPPVSPSAPAPSDPVSPPVSPLSADSSDAPAAPENPPVDFVEGRFFFDKHGRMSRFTCENRPFTTNGHEYALRPWQYHVEQYETGGQVHFPVEVKSAWQLENGPYEHFHGSIKSIRYNVRPAPPEQKTDPKHNQPAEEEKK